MISRCVAWRSPVLSICTSDRTRATLSRPRSRCEERRALPCPSAAGERGGASRAEGQGGQQNTFCPLSSTVGSVNQRDLAFAVVFLFCFSHFSAARSADDFPPWLASPKKALAFGRHPLVVLR